MEGYYARTTRFSDMYRAEYPDDEDNDQDFDEVEILDMTGHGGYKWEDFASLSREQFIWLGPDVVVNGWMNMAEFDGYGLDFDYESHLGIRYGDDIIESKNNDSWIEVYAARSAPRQAILACEFLLQLLATSNAPQRSLQRRFIDFNPFSGLALARSLEQSHNLQCFSVDSFAMDEGLCTALEAAPAGTRVLLGSCDPEPSGTIALANSLQRNLGATEIETFPISARLPVDALRGNSSLKSIILRADQLLKVNAEEDVLAFAQALQENQGLVNLTLELQSVTDANVQVLCRSLERHPSLEILRLQRQDHFNMAEHRVEPNQRIPVSDERKTRRTQCILQMMRINTILHTIQLDEDEFDLRLLRDEVRPRLQANLYRPRISAIAEAPDNLRPALLYRALRAVKDQPNLLWMFLSDNKDMLLREVPDDL
jgi:hypothetical protein